MGSPLWRGKGAIPGCRSATGSVRKRSRILPAAGSPARTRNHGPGTAAPASHPGQPPDRPPNRPDAPSPVTGNSRTCSAAPDRVPAARGCRSEPASPLAVAVVVRARRDPPGGSEDSATPVERTDPRAIFRAATGPRQIPPAERGCRRAFSGGRFLGPNDFAGGAPPVGAARRHRIPIVTRAGVASRSPPVASMDEVPAGRGAALVAVSRTNGLTASTPERERRPGSSEPRSFRGKAACAAEGLPRELHVGSPPLARPMARVREERQGRRARRPHPHPPRHGLPRARRTHRMAT